MSQILPVVNLPFLYINGLNISNDTTTPNTVFDIAPGQCRDYTDSVDIVLGNDVSGTGGITINGAVNGFNGLDTGTLAASSIYNVFIIADLTGFQPVGGIISLSNVPLLPSSHPPGSYSTYRRIGRITTNSSSQFVKFYQVGTGSGRAIFYDTPIALTVPSSGAPTTFAAVDLSHAIPAVNGIEIILNAAFTPGTLADTAALRPTGSSVAATVAPVIMTSAVATVKQNFPPFHMVALVASSKAEIDAVVTSSGDLLALNAVGYVDQL